MSYIGAGGGGYSTTPICPVMQQCRVLMIMTVECSLCHSDNDCNCMIVLGWSSCSMDSVASKHSVRCLWWLNLKHCHSGALVFLASFQAYTLCLYTSSKQFSSLLYPWTGRGGGGSLWRLICAPLLGMPFLSYIYTWIATYAAALPHARRAISWSARNPNLVFDICIIIHVGAPLFKFLATGLLKHCEAKYIYIGYSYVQIEDENMGPVHSVCCVFADNIFNRKNHVFWLHVYM